MASRQTLPNNLKRTCHDIGTFHGNGNGQTHICVSNVILISTANGRSSGNVHSFFDNTTTTFGTVLLHDGRDNHGSFVVIDNGIHEISTCNANESIAAGIDKCFLNTSKFCNGNTKLLSNTRIGTHSSDHTTPGTHRSRRQAHTTSFGKTFNKHVPSIATTFLSPQNFAHWDPNIFSFDCSIHKGSIERHVTRSHTQTRVVSLEERHCKSFISLSSEQTLWIRQVETKTHDTCYRSKCNVTFLERSHDTKFTVAFFHHTITSNERSRIRSGMRPRQSKARNQSTICKTR
mmetsp:Transcript_9825/g.17905  ORF Transcript_9825/g.17905 Transcript_9825/m.17905 type:complete len:289 (+) Transcript_9825:1015-1881(+)